MTYLDDRAYPEAPRTLCLPVEGDYIWVLLYGCLFIAPGPIFCLLLHHEVYSIVGQSQDNSDARTIIIQQRCPVVASNHKQYIQELLALLQSYKYNLALVLTGASSLDNEDGHHPAAKDMK